MAEPIIENVHSTEHSLVVWNIDDTNASRLHPHRGAGGEGQLPSIRDPTFHLRVTLAQHVSARVTGFVPGTASSKEESTCPCFVSKGSPRASSPPRSRASSASPASAAVTMTR